MMQGKTVILQDTILYNSIHWYG